MNTRTTPALEQLSSASGSSIGLRHASAGEISYLSRLMARHGKDVEGMARDRRLNWEQRTAGELLRGLRRTGLYNGVP
jgi:nucleolar protein 16